MKESISRTLRWLRRFRHRQGYGIHSPFAFNLVTGVIYEKGEYYAYDKLKALYLRQRPALRWKDCKLLFRLANFQHPERAYLLGIAPEDTLYAFLKAGSQHTTYTCGELVPASATGRYDLLVVSGDWESQSAHFLPCLRLGGLLIVIGLNNRQRKQAWQALLQAPQAQVSFDLYDFGLICYRPDLQRQHYLINYR